MNAESCDLPVASSLGSRMFSLKKQRHIAPSASAAIHSLLRPRRGVKISREKTGTAVRTERAESQDGNMHQNAEAEEIEYVKSKNRLTVAEKPRETQRSAKAHQRMKKPTEQEQRDARDRQLQS